VGFSPPKQSSAFIWWAKAHPTKLQAAALLIIPSMVTNIWQLCDGRSPLPMLLGMAGGQWLRKRISAERFKRWFFIGLLLLGAELALRGL